MKSNLSVLQSRGFVEGKDLIRYEHAPMEELICLLNDGSAQNRTIAAKLLQKFCNLQIIDTLCTALQKETKLYPKLAITETLSSFGSKSLPNLLPLLGEIGNNQYREIPKNPFLKKNYPLPRDIVARTICKMDQSVLPLCIGFLKQATLKHSLELIDAIGFLSFYSQNMNAIDYLFSCMEKYPESILLRWKVIRACEAFNVPQVITYLHETISRETNVLLIREAKRSLNQIKTLNNFHPT